MAFRATRAFLANNIALTRSKPFVARRIVNAQLGPTRQVACTTSERMRAIQYGCFIAGSQLPMSLAPDTAENLAKFSAALASVASNPTTALTARFLFDRGIVSISARFRATRSLAHACARASIPVRTRYEPGWEPPRPAPPLSRFRVTGRVRTTRAPSVRVVVTRVAFCMTKCRTFGSSWFRPQPKHDPQFPLRDLPGSRRQVRAEARRSFTLVREQSATLRSRAGYNHPRRLPIDVDAGS